MEKVNDLSPALMEIVNAAKPKQGQVIYFQSLRINAGGTTCPNKDRIFDPYAINPDGKTKGRYVDIAYVEGQAHAQGDRQAQYQFGEVKFRKTDGNLIGCSGNNRGGDGKFLFMFLTNHSKTNVGKPWYAPRDGQPLFFEMQIPELAAADKVKFRKRLALAINKIDEMPDSKLLDFALSLEMKGITEFSKMDEIRNKLGDIAEKNPDKVMNMDKDINLNMKLFIKQALQYGIWEENKNLKLFFWPDTKDPVFTMSPGQDLYTKTIEYLLGNGTDTYDLTKGLIEKAKAKLDKVKAKNPSPKQDGIVGDAVNEAVQSSDPMVGKKIPTPQFSEVQET